MLTQKSYQKYNSTYNRLKHHPYRVIPDDEFINLFKDLCRLEKLLERKLAKDSELKKLKEAFIGKANILQRPGPVRADLVGWLELVYDALPEDRFTNREIYAYEDKFRQHYSTSRACATSAGMTLKSWEYRGKKTESEVEAIING